MPLAMKFRRYPAATVLLLVVALIGLEPVGVTLGAVRVPCPPVNASPTARYACVDRVVLPENATYPLAYAIVRALHPAPSSSVRINVAEAVIGTSILAALGLVVAALLHTRRSVVRPGGKPR